MVNAEKGVHAKSAKIFSTAVCGAGAKNAKYIFRSLRELMNPMGS